MAYFEGKIKEENGKLAHQLFLPFVKEQAEKNGWQTKRYKSNQDGCDELILCGEGISKNDEIYIGLKTFQDEGSDIYNLLGGVFLGYNDASDFNYQPGAALKTIPAHNRHIQYFININPQRICFSLKVGTPVYMNGYLGKMNQYAMPFQYPYPCICGGMIDGQKNIRFSDTDAVSYLQGYRKSSASDWEGYQELGKKPISVYTPGGWTDKVWCYPYTSPLSWKLRDTGGIYHLIPVEIFTKDNLLGSLDGISFVSGFDNSVESKVTLDDGREFTVLQDGGETAFHDYHAMSRE